MQLTYLRQVLPQLEFLLVVAEVVQEDQLLHLVMLHKEEMVVEEMEEEMALKVVIKGLLIQVVVVVLVQEELVHKLVDLAVQESLL
jgi:hypothetical protein